MLDTSPQLQKILAGPRCARCGGQTRLLGIAPHRRRKWSHVWTLECTLCSTLDTVEKQIPEHAN